MSQRNRNALPIRNRSRWSRLVAENRVLAGGQVGNLPHLVFIPIGAVTDPCGIELRQDRSLWSRLVVGFAEDRVVGEAGR
jgi:hypothetical protein